ncbi:COX15/CtaA family protein [Sulfobacillus thermosulfidooxidans]|uniref:COX15/CtaA family protein n=1 Tax=Sulfobacillus thermosulfidooxidans TaxID=28034 RepID=UPI000C7180B4|nr:COX15/CtaA family protein [Sulfobacillus thermosulfidooxidans]
MNTKDYQFIPPSKAMKWTGIIATIGMYIINLVGFLDTQTGSALGCGPDWPLCNGQVIPNLSNIHVVIEFTHRMLVGGFALLATIYMIWALIRYRSFVEVRIFSLVGIGFIVVQSVLGALAVVFVNPPTVLALHLGFGLLAMVGVALLTVFLFQLDAESGHRRSGISFRQDTPISTKRWVWGTWIYTYIAIYWGSYVAFRGAGEACPTWPLCNGKVFPGFSGAVGLDFIHRLAAVGLAILTVLLLGHLRHYKATRPDLYRGAFWLFIAVIAQIITGANLALSHVATGPYLLHIATLMLLFADISYLVLQVIPLSKAELPNVETESGWSSRQVHNPQG